jgi:hypothetical protein
MVFFGRQILVTRLALAVVLLYFLSSPAAAVLTVVTLAVAYLATKKLRAVARARRLAIAAKALLPMPPLPEPVPIAVVPQDEPDWDYLRRTPAYLRRGKEIKEL